MSALTIMPEVDAIKSHGTYNPRSGSETKNIVCGDKLCSDVKSDGKANQQSRFQIGGVLQQSVNPTFSGDATISTPTTIDPDETWTVSPGVTITIDSGGTIDNYGTIDNLGTINDDHGTITNSGIIDNYGTIDNLGIIDNIAGIINNQCGAVYSGNPPTGPGIINTITCDTSATTDAVSVPDAPTSLTATALSSSEIDLSWTAPENNGGSPITGYMIYRDGDSAITVYRDGDEVVDCCTGTTYSDTGLDPETEYTYTVMAINSAGTSIPSNGASATTDAATRPSDLTATTISYSQINLSWTAPANDGGSPITGYMIYREGEIIVDDTASTGTTYSDDNLDPETEYTYTVMAINAIGASEESDEASATTDAETNSFTLAESGTTKLSKAVTKGTNLFDKGPYSISVEITADIDSVSVKGVPKLSNIAGTFSIDGANNLQDVTDHSFTKLNLVISKDLKSIKWTAKEGSGEFKFNTALNFNEPEDQDGKKSTIAKIVLSKVTFTPKVTTSDIDFN